MVILTGNSHPEFAKQVAFHLGLDIGKCTVYYKSNRETRIELDETVRGRDVYIIQTGTKNVNNDIMEAMVMCYACKTADARRISVAMPYLPYCKQNKMRKRGSIVCQLIARMLCRTGISQLITMDLHTKEIQGFFDVPVDNLRASPFLIKYIEENVPNYRNGVIVARNPVAVTRATSYADRLRMSLAVIHGEDKDESEANDGRTSPPPQMSNSSSQTPVFEGVSFGERPRKKSESLRTAIELLPLMLAKEKPPMNVVGDVDGRIAIIVEDLVDDVGQFVTAAELLHDRGASKIYVVATHGLLSSNSPQQLENSHIDEVVVTNTVPHEAQKKQCSKIKTVDVSLLMAEALRRIHNNESMSYLFTNIPKDD
jgi:phosphoribosylpyrophosphate synthetase